MEPAPDLNADCARKILLKGFTIHEQILLRALGPNWQEAVKMNFQAVHSLKLFSDLDTLAKYFTVLMKVFRLHDDPYYHLQVDEPDELVGKDMSTNASHMRNPSHLPELFPNLTKLIICSRERSRDYPSNMTDIPALLREWQELQSLTIFNLTVGCCKEIVTMQSLTRLELFKFKLADLTPRRRFLELLGRLEHLTLGYCFESVASLLETLNPDRLRRLSLNHVCLENEQLESLLRRKPALFSNLTHLTLQTVEPDSNYQIETL